MDNLTNIVTIAGTGLVYVFICTGFAYLAWRIADWRTKNMDDIELIHQGNMAVGIRRFGLLTMFGLGFSGALYGTGTGFAGNVLALVVDGVLITVFAFACRHINDLVMMGHIDNDAHCRNNNIAVGVVEAANYMATGLILWGVFIGEGTNLMKGAVSSVIWFAIGQATLLVSGWVTEKVFTRFNIRDEIEKGNAAAGVYLAGILVPLGILIRANIIGPTRGLVMDILLFAVYIAAGFMLMAIFSLACSRILLSNTSMKAAVEKNQNVSVTIVGAAVNVLVALVVVATL